MLHTKGSPLFIIGLTILCVFVVAHAQSDAKPVVISATRVPVTGGTVQIYGHNFGSDASRLKVHIEDPESEGFVECTNVAIVTPNRVISCNVATTGTGKSMHVTVALVQSTDANGGIVTISNDDTNVAFNREVPRLDKLVYSVEEKTIVLEGSNFGFDIAKVSVLLSGDDYPILALDNNAITLRFLRHRRQDGYIVPDSNLAFVTVDGQSNAGNMTATRAALVTSPVEEPTDATPTKKTDKAMVAGIVGGGALLVVVVSVFVAAFAIKRKRQDAFIGKDVAPSNTKKPETGRASHETGRALHFALIGHQKESPVVDLEDQAPPEYVHDKEATVEQESVDSNTAQDVDTKAVQNVDAAPATKAIDAIGAEGEADEEHHSLEEIDLHDDIYEKNEDMSDSSFSESSDEDEDEEDIGASSSFSAEFSDASPAHSPAGGKRQQLQMSSEFPSSNLSMSMSRIPSTRTLAPSPPVLLTTKESRLPASSLRTSTIPPSLSLDDGVDSDGSPLPSPRTVSPNSAKGKKKGAKKGMVRVPSSRLASRVSMPKNAFDSPQL